MSDTPRTDAVDNMNEDFDVVGAHMTALARQLEQELTEKTNLLKIAKSVINDLITEGTGVLYKDCCNRRKKAEAEVERLKSELHQSAYLLATTGREDLARRVIEKSDDENSILNPNSRYVKELLK